MKLHRLAQRKKTLFLVSLALFFVFPFPVFQTSYKKSGSTCQNVPEGYDGCNDVINAMYEPEKFNKVVQIRNILPGYVLDKQLRKCTPTEYKPLDKCISYENESFYTYAPYYSLVVPFIAAVVFVIIGRKNNSK